MRTVKDWWVEPEKVVRNDHTKILWDFSSRLTSICFASDSMLINYKEQTDLIINIAMARDENIQDKELETIDKYQLLKIELGQLESQNYGDRSSCRCTWCNS